MFWIDNNGIFRADLNGENVTPIVGADQDGIYPLALAIIPEPATWLLAVVGLFVLFQQRAVMRRRSSRYPTRCQLR